MPFNKITSNGENFIRTVCSGTGNSLLSGRNNYNLPYSSVQDTPTIFTTNVEYYGQLVTTNQELGEALIYWFNLYSEQYDLDANIIAAQAYVESKYKVWNYSPTGAMGISQFISSSFNSIAIANNHNILPKFTTGEIDRLTLDIENPLDELSFQFNSKINSIRETARENKTQQHINITNNPDLVIKAQCRFMRFISDRNNNLASSSLFAYNRGSGLTSKTYPEIINKAEKNPKVGNIKEGLDYVLLIFNCLGDKNNEFTPITPKPKGISFGYEKKLKLGEPFDLYKADVDASNQKYN